jgi:hypothetical protein
LLPLVGVGNNMPILRGLGAEGFLVAPTLDSFALDYAARQKAGGTHLNFFIVEQFPVLPARSYSEDQKQFVKDRALELLYTSLDLSGFARDIGYEGPPFRWDDERRFLMRCELDALYFHLYGIARADVDYIMNTFPIVRRKDEHQFGEYRTKRVILEIYDEMAAAGPSYATRLDPAPADPRVAHSPKLDTRST